MIVKGIKQKSQILDFSKRAFYLTRLNVYEYRSGFHRFMVSTDSASFRLMFFNDAAAPIEIIGANQQAITNVDPIEFEDEAYLNIVYKAVCSDSKAISSKKTPQLL